MQANAQSWITPMLEALPRIFDFYHLGQIELEEPECETLTEAMPLFSEDRIAIGYRFEGEARGVLLLLLEPGMDLSTYSEAGNIIASRLATELSDRHGLDVTISPPQVLSPNQLKTLLKNGVGTVRAYAHRHDNRVTRLQAVLLPAAAVPSEATGNA